MPEETKGFVMFPHDWHSTDYVAEWITRDGARDPERRPLLRRMLSFAPFPRDAELDVLDVGAGYGAVSEEVLQAFPAARVTLQDYSQPMLDRARQCLAGRADQLRYVLCDLVDPSAAPSTSLSPPSLCTICATPKRFSHATGRSMICSIQTALS